MGITIRKPKDPQPEAIVAGMLVEHPESKKVGLALTTPVGSSDITTYKVVVFKDIDTANTTSNPKCYAQWTLGSTRPYAGEVVIKN